MYRILFHSYDISRGSFVHSPALRLKVSCLRVGAGRPNKLSPREPAGFGKRGRRNCVAMTREVWPFSYSTESRV